MPPKRKTTEDDTSIEWTPFVNSGLLAVMARKDANNCQVKWDEIAEEMGEDFKDKATAHYNKTLKNAKFIKHPDDVYYFIPLKVGEKTEEAKKPEKKPRRTKAQIEADKALEKAEESGGKKADTPVPSRDATKVTELGNDSDGELFDPENAVE